MNVGIIVFSRMSSSRLPGKAMLNIGGIPLIERVLRRASLSLLPIGLATSSHHSDDILADFVSNLGFKVFRGDLHNVLDRGAKAAESFGFQYFFRLCGDRPVFDLSEIQFWLESLKREADRNIDLITNFTSGLIKGITTELISTNCLSGIAGLNFLSDSQREHVTSYFYDFPFRFNILYLPSKFIHLKDGCLAIDTVNDFEVISNFFSNFNKVDIPTEKVVEYLGLNSKL